MPIGLAVNSLRRSRAAAITLGRFGFHAFLTGMGEEIHLLNYKRFRGLQSEISK